MNPKSGKAGTAIQPTEPEEAKPADQADPGEVQKIKAAERQTQSGKYGSVPIQPHKGPQSEEEKKEKRHWIEIELRNEKSGKPIAGESYEITMPDGSVSKGTLDEKGFARIDGIDEGTCKVSFPRFDKSSWKKK